jgi:hypothetical protein
MDVENNNIIGKNINIGEYEKTSLVLIMSENVSGQISNLNVDADKKMVLSAGKLCINTDGDGATYIGNSDTTLDIISSETNINVEGLGPVGIGNITTPKLQMMAQSMHLCAETLHITGDSAFCLQVPHSILKSQENKESLYTLARTGLTDPKQSLVIYQVAFPLNTMVHYDLTICGKTMEQGGVWMVRGHFVCGHEKAAEHTMVVTGDPMGEVCVEHHPTTGFVVVVKGQKSTSWVVTGRLTRL